VISVGPYTNLMMARLLAPDIDLYRRTLIEGASRAARGRDLGVYRGSWRSATLCGTPSRTTIRPA
jgi:hypothetical protein